MIVYNDNEAKNMKISVEINSEIEEEEIIIKARTFSDEIKSLSDMLENKKDSNDYLLLFDEKKEYLININDIIFFETENDNVYAHTKDYAYLCKMRLYELEKKLPKNFERISKSAIINIFQIYSIEKKFNAASLIQFNECHKEVYISRRYYKMLKEKLLERSR